MMKMIGAVLGGPTPHGAGGAGQSRHPVRRGSRLVGTCEAGFWRRSERAEVRRVVLAAKRYELAGRQRGRRNGPLGHVALEVLELLANLVSYRSGRLEPSYGYLMAKLKRSKDAVHGALTALRAHGFLDWLRRHERIELVEGPGPRVRQVSNAYRLCLPPRAARLLGHLLGAPPPLPDDLAEAREERAAWVRAHKEALPLSELPLVEVADEGLARVLGALGEAVSRRERERELARLGTERESARQGETKAKRFEED